MNSIGFLKFESTLKEKNALNQLINTDKNKQTFTLVEVKEKKKISLLDGLIIYIEKTSDYIKAFQFLLDLKDDYSLFIWILCEEEDSELPKIYPQLSDNSIIQVLKKDVSSETLVLLIKKALNFKNSLLNKLEGKNNLHNDIYLDTTKRSLEVQDKSILLTRKEYKIVELLYQNIEEVVPYHEIYKAIYDKPFKEADGKYRIANFIFHIRNKLKEQSYYDIEIIRTRGYVLTYSDNDK